MANPSRERKGLKSQRLLILLKLSPFLDIVKSVSGSESNSTVLFFPVIAALVGMALGFVTIWSQIRSQSRQAKQESEAARADLDKRIRDYLDLRLTNMQMSIDHLREGLARVERKINRQQKEEES